MANATIPNFLVVGAPKAGTTSMNRYLSEHLEVYMPARKGLHYFTCQDLMRCSNGPGDKEAIQNICTTFDQYQSFYATVPSSALAIGDASPSYLFYSNCIPSIKQTLGSQVKIIIMIRNPVERAFSNYLHMVSNKRENLSFFDALLAEDGRVKQGWGDFWQYRGHSLYYAKLKDYLDAFGASQVKVINHDEFAHNTLRSMQDIYTFLNVDPSFVPMNINVIYGKTGTSRSRLLSEWVNKSVVFKPLFIKILPKKILRRLKVYKDRIIEKNTVKEVNIAQRAIEFLNPFFQEDIALTENLLQIDLRQWK